MPGRAVSYFVYYRVAPGRESAARKQVEQLQESLHGATGVRGRLMTKRGEPNLWMEVYETVRDCPAFERAMEQALTESEFDTVLAAASRRHVERFET
jgi:bacterioferritin (cytochrome b1)